MLTHGSLFAGIGGFDLGFERAGIETVWQIEMDTFCREVLAKHWLGAKRYGDIRNVRAEELEPVDVISSGFPCQPVSIAGDRRAQHDERWLWPQALRIIRCLGPRWVVVENVIGLLSANDGRAMGEILRDLASIGYDAEWESLPAAAFGAPHLRFRVFIVAYPNRSGDQGQGQGQEPIFRPFPLRTFAPEAWGDVSQWEAWLHQPDVHRVPYGFPHVVDRVRALGNAVTVTVAEWIGRRLVNANLR